MQIDELDNRRARIVLSDPKNERFQSVICCVSDRNIVNARNPTTSSWTGDLVWRPDFKVVLPRDVPFKGLKISETEKDFEASMYDALRLVGKYDAYQVSVKWSTQGEKHDLDWALRYHEKIRKWFERVAKAEA